MPRTAFAPGHIATLRAVCDTVLPQDSSAWRASAHLRALDVAEQLPRRRDVRALRRLLTVMEMSVANLFLTGRLQRFSDMTLKQREAYLRSLARNRSVLVRSGHTALKRLAAIAYYAESDAEGHNPTWAEMGYPGPITPRSDSGRSIRPVSVTHDPVLQCDVVVVGSGAGGGIVAAELAEAGHDVVVVERGRYLADSDFTGRETPMLRALYLDGGLTSSRDNAVSILAGSCLGGGTVVNYTTSFRTPDTVREEWARQSGLNLFVGEDFTRSLDAACNRFGVNLKHNAPSGRDRIMARGLQACGWHVDSMPRDVEGCTQDDVCGYCGLGCVRGAKRSTLKTCLEEAHKLGTRILVNTTAERVIANAHRAGGVEARTSDGHAVTIRARVVVAAAGAIHTPALLLRSGLDGPIGRTLRLHPSTGVWGVFDEQVRPWTGTLQALYSDQWANLDDGYGFRFETVPVHPVLLSLGAPWESAGQFDRTMRTLPHLSVVGILLRDRDPGRVWVDRHGNPTIQYRLSARDRAHIRKGVESAARVLRAAGAREVSSTQSRQVVMKGDESVERWMERVDGAGYGPHQTQYFSFHQMGTCPMGANPATSVVNERGETHAMRNLYVADSSLFPSASGVNPMISIAALGHYVAQRVKAHL